MPGEADELDEASTGRREPAQQRPGRDEVPAPRESRPVLRIAKLGRELDETGGH